MNRHAYPVGALPVRNFAVRLWRNLWMMPAWFCPVKRARIWFHRWRGVQIHSNVEIGYMVLLDNRRPEWIVIEQDAYVCAHSVILTHDLSRKNTEGIEISGPVVIRKGAFVGMNATVLPGIEIGQYAVVAAGAVVTRDVLPFTIVGGNPAKPIGQVAPTKPDL